MPFTQPLLVLSAWVPLSHALTASYFATCLKGLEPILAAELASPLIGAQKVVEGRLGVEFSGPPSVGARAVLWSRSATRIMETISIADSIHTQPDLFDWCYEDVPWGDLLAPKQTLSVQVLFSRPPHPCLPDVAPHFSHISHFN